MGNQKSKDNFTKAYKVYVNENGKKPNSISTFCEGIKKKDSDFYEFFSSFETLESYLLVSMIDADIELTKNAPEYETYSTRERLLSLFYTHFATLANNRSFILQLKELNKMKLAANVSNLKKYHDSFTLGVEQILQVKTEEDAIPDRMFVSSKYSELIWANFMFVFNFWINDKSANFEKTDACIEKSINLSLDLMQENIFDHAFDFGKFVIQNLVKR